MATSDSKTEAKPSTARFTWPNGKTAALSLTFDDARVSQADLGLPLFERHGVRATFYNMPAAMKERRDAWKKAVDHGHEIGNHTVQHPCGCDLDFVRKRGENGGVRYALEDYTLQQMSQELDSANDSIRREYGVTPTTFAYPCGQTYVGQGAQRQSYVPLIAGKFIIGRGANGTAHNTSAGFNRSQVSSSGIDKASFESVRPMVEAAVRDGGWLIFYSHSVGTQAGEFQTTMVDTLDQLCQYAKQHPQLWLDTVANIGMHLQQSGA